MTLSFTIPGEPRAKARPRFRRYGNGAISTYTDKATTVYERAVKYHFRVAHRAAQPMRGPVNAVIVAVFGVPLSDNRKAQGEKLAGILRPTKRPDLDNIAKIVLDSLNGLAYRDDSQVVALTVEKRYGIEPCVNVELTEAA